MAGEFVLTIGNGITIPMSEVERIYHPPIAEFENRNGPYRLWPLIQNASRIVLKNGRGEVWTEGSSEWREKDERCDTRFARPLIICVPSMPPDTFEIQYMCNGVPMTKRYTVASWIVGMASR